MRTEQINGELCFPVPDGFERMEQERLRRMYPTTENLVGFSRREDNAMINVGFAPKKVLASLILSPKDVIRNYDRSFSKRLSQYRRTGTLSATIAGSLCPGMSFEFNTLHENVPMKAEVYSMKHKGAFYAVVFMERAGNSEDLQKLSAAVLPEIRFAE